MSLKQKKMKFKPRIKLNHNITYTPTYRTNLIHLEILQKRVIRTIAKPLRCTYWSNLSKSWYLKISWYILILIQLLFSYSYQNHTLPLKFHCKFTLQSQIHSYIIQENRVNFVCLSVVLEHQHNQCFLPFFL